MARVSKYQGLVGQTFNVKGLEVKVVGYHKEPRTSKNGRKYSAYRLDVQLKDFQDILEISTTSWKNQSFIKRLVKTSVNPSKPVVYSCLPVVYNPIQKDFLGRTSEKTYNYIGDLLGNCSSVKELNKAYKKVVKYYHPDYLGRELFPSELSLYTWLKTLKDELVKEIRLMEEVFGIKLDKLA